MVYKSKVFYQIYPRSFQDSNDDGIGDINGIISRLDYLKELGVDDIWLSPVYQSPNADFGYDISDYYSINPEYGTMADMELLIKEASKRGIGIIMDLVMNHTSDQHPWFVQSKQRNSPYRDYYIYKETKNGKRPNNWTSFFGGKAWSQTEDGSYYLHLFAKHQPDLNLKNENVVLEFIKIIQFWLDKGIKGFRCDVVNVIYKESLENGKWRLVLKGLEHYHCTDGNHQILKRLRKEVFNPNNAITVGETVLVSIEQAEALLGKADKELDLVFAFEHMETDQINNKWFRTKFKPNKFLNVIRKWQKQLSWNTIYFENHDQPRSISRFGSEIYHQESGKMLSVLLLTLKGTPFIYQGQEIGMLNVDYQSIDDYQDVETKNIWALSKKLHFPTWYRKKMIKNSSRDNARSPMQWDESNGFSNAKPWLAINQNKQKVNLKQQQNDPNSIYAFYKSLIAYRKTSEALKQGEIKFLFQKRGVVVYERLSDHEKVLVLVNMTNKYRKIKNIPNGRVVFNNYETLANKMMPYQAVIIEKDTSNLKASTQSILKDW
ncbi:MAG: alpha-glucosidase [Acholeplasma sp.]|nr:alpha-glucosidase [Acholeplasma sp.]